MTEWTRTAMLASFYAACRVGARSDVVIMNGAALAGMLLHEHRTAHDALDACRRMTAGKPWTRAAELLAELADDEVADTVPPMNVAAGGEGR